MLINPGSRIGEPGEGWTNTCETARGYAGQWLAQMHGEGMTGVELLDSSTERDGRWIFTFRHAVTGKTVELEIHGIDDTDAYKKRHVFEPRIYWNGSSTSDPKLEHFAAPGFRAVRTFVAEEAAKAAGEKEADNGC